MSTQELIERMKGLVHKLGECLQAGRLDEFRQTQAELRPVEVELLSRRYANVTGGGNG